LFDGSHTYADDGRYTVIVTIEDQDGNSDSETFQVQVNNLAPALSVIKDQEIEEGTELSLPEIGFFSDPGFDNPLNPAGETKEAFAFSIDWGDGSAPDKGAATVDAIGGVGFLTQGSFDGSHAYADDDTYTVTVLVEDDDGDFDTQTFQVTVNDVEPALNISSNSSVAAGEVYNLNLSVIDSGDDPIANWVIDWGDGKVQTIDGHQTTAKHIYRKPLPLVGGFDGDGAVDGNDLVRFRKNLGQTAVGLDGDLDNDGDVDHNDMVAFISNFGRIGYKNYTISATASNEDGTYNTNSQQEEVQKAIA